jgi:hypothetical protein
VASTPDFHSISPANGTENADPTLNYVGGSNYLIDLPPGQSADLQIFNPSFAPDSNDQSGGQYTYHENDSSFPNGSTRAVDYSAMAYTLFSVSTLSSRLQDTKISQEVFYPYNATGLYGQSGGSRSLYYFDQSGNQRTISNYTPTTYHQWVSAINFSSGNSNERKLYCTTCSNLGGYLTNSSSVHKYYRLEVDNLNWDGSPTCTSLPCDNRSTPSSAYSKAHKGYAVRLTTTSNLTQACVGCGSVSAMGDMIVYTPINAANGPLSFSIPLFALDSAYAGKVIQVNIFDPGDVGGGPAYMALQQPDGNFASLAGNMTDPGTSLSGCCNGTGTVNSLNTWPVNGATCGACFQTAGSGGGAIYNGHWIAMQIKVPSGQNGYWNLVYSVSQGAVAGDTFAVQAGFNGSPDHLLP